MRKRAAPPAPQTIDPAGLWPRLDRLVRVALPARLDALGFPAAAVYARGSSPIESGEQARAFKAVRDELSALIFAESLRLAAAAAALLGGDELEYLRARAAADDHRFDHAWLAVSAVEVAAQWSAPDPGGLLSDQERVVIAYRQVDYAEKLLGGAQ